MTWHSMALQSAWHSTAQPSSTAERSVTLTHLVSHVKEGEELLLLHNSADLFPLLGCGVHPSRVVCTGVQ